MTSHSQPAVAAAAVASQYSDSAATKDGGRMMTSAQSASSTHAYQVALSTLRERCRRQSEQLQAADSESRRLLADKSQLLAEIEQLRELVGGHRERGTQMGTQLTRQRRRTARLKSRLSRLRRRMAAVGLHFSSSSSSDEDGDEKDDQEGKAFGGVEDSGAAGGGEFETERDTDEMDVVRVALATSRATDRVRSADGGGKCDPRSGSSTQPGALGRQLESVAQMLSARNAQLRVCIERLTLCVEPAAASSDSHSLPALYDIPLSSPTSFADGAGGGSVEAAAGSTVSSLVCPLCSAQFGDPVKRDEFEEHVFSHLQQMILAS